MRLPALHVVVLAFCLCQGPSLSQSDGGARGAARNDTRPLIAGEIAPAGRFSYMCSLRTEGHHEHFCGALLFRPDWILTAAHCIDHGEDKAPLRPIVYCGIERLNQTDPDLVFDVGISFIHEKWSGSELHGYDVALLRLNRNSSSALDDLPTLNAADNSFEVGEFLTALGWGTTKTSENSNELRMARTLEFVPSRSCNEDWWGGRIKEDRMICAGLRKERVCRGDSGGPLIRPDIPQGKLSLGKTSRDLVLGITSFNYESEKCGERKRPAVFTRIAFFVDWISDKIGEDVTKGREQSPEPIPAGRKRLSSLFPSELVEEMKKAFKKDNAARAKRILEFLHVKETLEATIPGVGRSDLPLIHAAAMFDAPKCAQVLIDAGAGLKSRVDYYYELAPLHVCAIFGSLKVAKVLLSRKNGAPVDLRDYVGDAAIHKAATHGRTEVMEFLFEKSKKSDWFPVNNAGASPLHEAARAGHVNAVKLLLEKGANINWQNEDGWTPLHHASYNNHISVVEVLLEDGANVDVEDSIGETALHKACYNGNSEIVRLLLLNRANPHYRDNLGDTPMINAVWRGHIEPVKMLLRSGVSANTANDDRYTALHVASSVVRATIARLLIDEGASIEAEDDEGSTPLLQAVSNSRLKMVKLLVSNGARVDTYIDGAGQTLLHKASINGDTEIVKVLLRNGADVHATDDDGETPLHEAAEYGNRNVAEVLLGAGALKNALDNDGYTPQDRVCDDSDSCHSVTESALRFMLEP